MTLARRSRVAITGAPLAFERQSDVVNFVGRRVTGLSKKTWPEVLVVGCKAWPLRTKNNPELRPDRRTRRLMFAERLQASGFPVRIIPDTAIRAEREPSAHCMKRLTPEQVARSIGVDRTTLDLWVYRHGVLKPDALGRFSERDVLAFRTLARLRREGVGAFDVARSFERLRRYLPLVDSALSVFDRLTVGPTGELCVRSDDQLISASGQMFLDFDPEPVGVVGRIGRDPHTEFRVARNLEDAGRYDEAAELLAGIADRQGWREAHYNLAINRLRAGAYGQAVSALREVVRQEPGNLEAWYHLGVACWREGLLVEAIEALEAAIKGRPLFADAHLALARVFEAAGRSADAKPHWLAYLNVDPVGAVADLARSRLAASDKPDRNLPDGLRDRSGAIARLTPRGVEPVLVGGGATGG